MSRLLVLQHLARERPGLFAKVAKERGFTVCTFRLDHGDSLPELRNGDLLLVLGGPMSIRDIGTSTYPWLIEEVGLIKEALNQDVGIIGVCLGAQLLAYAAGGDVEMIQEEVSRQPLAEIGWDNIFPQSPDYNFKLTRLLRHPFPGPGLAIRIPGVIDKKKILILQKADHIFIKYLKEKNLYNKIWQAFVVLLPVKSVGVMAVSYTHLTLPTSDLV